MSRNFEMLRAEGNETLFLSAAQLHPSLAAEPIAEVPVLNKPGAASRGAEEPGKKDRANEPPPRNGYPATAAPARSSASTKWFASLRARSKSVGRSLNGAQRNGSGSLDLKAMTRQEEIKLVQRVFFPKDAGSNRAVVFAGIENVEASARICARAAETLAAQVQSSVCVVDSNLLLPSLHQYFGTTSSPGLANAVLQTGPIREFARQLFPSNLWFIPCGDTKENSWTLLNPNGLRARLAELRTQFGHVLINAPPMSVFSDSALIGQTSDGVVLVVEAHSTRREVTQRVIENLETAKVQICGAVLNNRTFPIPESVYRKL
jgi:Mrp family chromosome partitioning ATPase